MRALLFRTALITMLLTAVSAQADVIGDNFDSVSYSNNDSTAGLDWATDWAETGETTSPSAGDMQITGNRLRLQDDDREIVREVDISGYTSATLSFDYEEVGFDGINDWVEIRVRTGGAGAFIVLERFAGSAVGTGSASYNIDIYIANDLEIQFATSDNNGMGNFDDFFVDNLAITLSPDGGGGGASGTFLDLFTTAAYNNQDGTENWLIDWTETGDDDSATDTSGDINITGGELHMQDANNSIQRSADLSPYTSATLSFDYREVSMGNANEWVDLEIRTGGGSWIFLQRFAGPVDDTGSVSIDITSYIASDTEIRFTTSANMGNGDDFYIDNFLIDASGSGGGSGCSALFPDGVSSHDASGKITIQFNSQVINSPDNILDTFDLEDNSGGNSCNTGPCSKSDSISDVASFSSFPGGSDVTVPFGATQALAPGDYGTLTVNSTATVQLSEGEYTFDSDINIGFDANVVIIGAGTVRLYASSNVSFTSQSDINVGGSADQLAVYAGSDFNMNSQSQAVGFFYGSVNVTLDSTAAVTGGLSGSTVVMNSPSTVTYDSAALADLDFGSICSGGSTPTPATLVTEWRMDEFLWTGVVGEMVDSNASGLGGQAINGASTDDTSPAIAGDPGTCSYGLFDQASSQAIEVPFDASLNPDGSFSVAFWARVDGSLGAYRSPLTSRTETGGNNRSGYNVFVSAANNWEFWTGEGTTLWDIHTGPAITQGAWTHIAITFDVSSTAGSIHTGTKTLYVDGVATSQTGDYQASTADPLRIGRGVNLGAPDFYFDGAVDEVRVYDGVLTSTEVTALMTEARTCPQPPTLVAEYQFDELVWAGVADEIADNSGNANDGQSFNGTTTDSADRAISGDPGTCSYGDFDGGTQYVLMADDATLDLPDELSVTAWIQPGSIPGSGLHTIVSKDGNYEFHLNTSGQIFWYYEPASGGSRTLTTTGTALVPGTWYHVAITYSDGAQSIYIDGVERASDNFSGTLNTNNDALYIGTDIGFVGSRNFDGLIDEVRIYDGALSQPEVDVIRAETHACINLVPTVYAEYRFDEASWAGAVNEVVDATGNGHDGIALQTPTVGTITDGKICRAGSFPDIDNETSYAVDTGVDIDDELGDEGSISLWFRSNVDWATAGTARTLFDASTDAPDDKYFYLLLNANGSLSVGLETTTDADHRQTSGVQSIAADQWVHLVVNWDLNSASIMEIWLDGAQLSTTLNNNTVSGPTIGEMRSLYIGDNRGAYNPPPSGADPNNAANGNIDEVLIFNDTLSSGQIASIRTLQDAGLNLDGSARTCPVVGLDHLEIDTNGVNASTCLPQTITIRACSDGLVPCTLFTGYTNTVTLSTSSSHGDWAVGSANGVLDNATAGDGDADYSFVLLDGGEVDLELSNEFAEALTITVDDLVDGFNVVSSTLTFNDNLFVITDIDGLAGDDVVVAGRDHSYQVEAVRRDITEIPPVCGVVTGYVGAMPLKVWRSLDGANPAGASDPDIAGVIIPDTLPGTENVTLTFTAGVATFNLSTSDVGKYTLEITDDLAPIPFSGTSATQTVRPFAIGLTAAGNPAGTATIGAPYITAGSDFDLLVGGYVHDTNQDTDDDGIPDSGFDTNLIDLTPRFAADVAVSLSLSGFTPVGTLGTLTPVPLTLVAGAFSGGSATQLAMTYDEVGSMQLEGAVTDYLTPGIAVAGTSLDIGRFYPASLELATGTFDEEPGCTDGFVYLGEPSLEISFTLEARNVAGNVTVNYDDATLNYGFLATVAVVAEGDDDGNERTTDINPGVSVNNWVAGQLIYTGVSQLNRVGLEYITVLAAGVTVTSAPDGEDIASLDMDANAIGCATCDARQLTVTLPFDMRYGRLRGINAFGPEVRTLPVPIIAEYFDDVSASFIANTLDTCTVLGTEQFDLSAIDDDTTPDDSSADPAAGIIIGVAVDSGTSNGSLGQPTVFVGDVVGLEFSPPGAGNTGSIQIQLDLDIIPAASPALPWLKFDWDGLGGDENPPAFDANFGTYRANDRVIFRREVLQ